MSATAFRRSSSLILLAALSTSLPPAVAPSAAPSAAPGIVIDLAAQVQTQRTVRVRVLLPQNDAELTVDGKLVEGTGEERDINLPSPGAGRTTKHKFVTNWKPNTYTTMTRSAEIELRPGGALTVDLSHDDPKDRVRVIYVPTPADIADEMAKLAGITPKDVVFEPGCGDARITIAAVRAGARRGVGIDIDPERVKEAQENVKAAGLSDRIEIRLGDALDIKDLSSATVVMLYMGDHFDMLIRPALWRDLPVGARVVSHRFLMGDWEPDKTVTVTSDFGAEYELHLWTITPAIKRRAR